MTDQTILEELFRLFSRPEMPGGVRSAIASELGQELYYPAKQALVEGLSDEDPIVRDSCIEALANHWELQEIAPRLIKLFEDDEYDFVRMRAAQGLGSLRYREALPVLKRIILDSSKDESLQETAYEAVLSILGKDEYDILKEGVDKPTVIDWDLVRSL